MKKALVVLGILSVIGIRPAMAQDAAVKTLEKSPATTNGSPLGTATGRSIPSWYFQRSPTSPSLW